MSADAAAEARKKLIERALAARQREPSISDDSGEESDGSDSHAVRLKPVFVPKGQRVSEQQRVAREQAERAGEERRVLDCRRSRRCSRREG